MFCGGAVCAALILTACDKRHAPELRTFTANGVVKELETDGRTVVIQHEAISNYMGAMTMPFEVRDTNELRGLHAGDAITFHLNVTSSEGWISGITARKKAPAPPQSAEAPSPYHFSKAVPELELGDALPDYHFTNELGQAVNLSKYRGGALAFTFFFTSCPYPNFCPRMTSNFEEVAAQLRRSAPADARWQLLSISFDPKTDTPQRLRDYAEAAHYDPAHWSFLTGDLEQISELTDNFGENFYTTGTSISHNLRTVVVDPQGKVRKVFEGNTWTPAEVVAEMLKALRP